MSTRGAPCGGGGDWTADDVIRAQADAAYDRLTGTTHGGKRPGAGRPTGSSKPDSRRNRLTQRYNDDEIATIRRHAAAAGYGDDLTTFIRDQALQQGLATVTLRLRG